MRQGSADKRAAAAEETGAHLLESLWQGHHGEALTVAQSVVANGDKGLGQHDLRETFATSEGVVADLLQALWQGDVV